MSEAKCTVIKCIECIRPEHISWEVHVFDGEELGDGEAVCVGRWSTKRRAENHAEKVRAALEWRPTR